MKAVIIIVISITVFLVLVPGLLKQNSVETRLFASQNLADNWSKVTARGANSVTALSDILSLAVDPSQSGVVYAGTKERGIFKSENAGKNWQRLSDDKNLLRGANVYDIAVSPDASNPMVYIGTYESRYGRIFRSADRGRTWENVYVTSEPKYAIFCTVVDNYEPNVVYAGTGQGGLLRSWDFGKSWEIVKWFGTAVSDIALNPKNTKEIYVSTFESGIYKTEDKGQSWRELGDLTRFEGGQKIEEVMVDGQRPEIVYAASAQGVLVSYDGGWHFEEMKTIAPPSKIWSLALDPNNTDHLYYAAGSVLYQSLDRGESWRVHEIFGAGNIKAIAVDPVNPDNVYVGGGK